MSRIAERTADETGRETAIFDVRLGIESSDEVDVVRLSARWHGLVAATNRTLTMAEPFASGFSADRPLRVSGFDGYKVATTVPLTAGGNKITATWDARIALDGFKLIAEETKSDGTEPDGSESESSDPDITGKSVPRFGIVVAVFAFLTATLVAIHR